jgi:hypothetical protein
MILAVLAAIELVVLHTPDGLPLEVNPRAIVRINEPRSQDTGHFHGSVKCLVFTSDTHYFPVAETCTQVHQLLGVQ